MPKWGLTQEQIDAEPWGLSRKLLRARKTITNSVQGDVYLNRIEELVLDSPPIQRLRRIKQLGNTSLVYPDGTHTRFSHVLGALRTSQDLLDAVMDQENRPEPQPDVFSYWRATISPEELVKRKAEVTVLTRLGALLHDMCHVPFSHTVEDDLGLLTRHDGNDDRFNTLWELMPKEFLDATTPALANELKILILSKVEIAEDWQSKYPFVQDLVGNTICADLLDYLPRDHQNLGLPYALGHRFVEGLFVTAPNHPHMKERVAVELYRHGQKRADVESELLKALRYRYEETERALNHPAKLAPDAMIGKLLSMWRDAIWVDKAESIFETLPEALHKDIDSVRSWIEQHDPAAIEFAATQIGAKGVTVGDVVAAIDTQIEKSLEQQLLKCGDEGLLEGLAYRWFDQPGGSERADTRRDAISELAMGVLERRLYKCIGRSLPQDRELAGSLWDQYQKADDRRRLEVEAAEFIGLKDKWHLVLWIPAPEMKLKQAEVLVGDGEHVSSLHVHSDHVNEIYNSHRDLWCIGVYVHPSLRIKEFECDVLLEWLRIRLGLAGWVNRPIKGSIEKIVVEHFAVEKDLTMGIRDRLLAGVSALSSDAAPSLKKILDSFESSYELMNELDSSGT